MNESIFRTFFRGFFARLGTIMGIILGIFFAFMLIGLFSGKSDNTEIKQTFAPQIQADAKGERVQQPATAPVVLQINIHGVIGLDELDRHSMRELLIESREKTLDDDRVKAILLSIDSPGGTVTDADGIYHLLKSYKERYNVPIYAYVDGLCASGGMYIACAADKIYSNGSGLVGSVGVLIPTVMNFSKLMDKVGIESIALSAGKGKGELNPFRPWAPDEAKNYQELVDDFYKTFVHVVTSNRPKVSEEDLVNVYGAHVFPANRATEIGLIDGYDYNLNKTLQALVETAKLDDEPYQVIELKRDNWLQSLFRSQSAISLLKGEVVHRLDMGADLHPKLMNQYLYLYRP